MLQWTARLGPVALPVALPVLQIVLACLAPAPRAYAAEGMRVAVATPAWTDPASQCRAHAWADEITTALRRDATLLVLHRHSVLRAEAGEPPEAALRDSLGVTWLVVGKLGAGAIDGSVLGPEAPARLQALARTPEPAPAARLSVKQCATLATARALVARGQARAALAALEQLSLEAPEEPLGAALLAQAFASSALEAGLPRSRRDLLDRQALAQAERAVVLAPGSVESFLALGKAHDYAGRADAARAAYTQALGDPGLSDARVNLGLLLLDGQDLPSALEHLGAAWRLEPSWALARQNLGLAYLLADDGAAAELLEPPQGPDPLAWLLRGRALILAGRLDDADAVAATMTRQGVARWAAATARAHALLARGRAADVVAELGPLLPSTGRMDGAPGTVDVEARILLARAQARLGRLDLAQSGLAAVVDDPGGPRGLRALARRAQALLEAATDPAGAIGKLQALLALEEHRRDHEATYDLAVLVSRQGDLARAEDLYAKAIDLNPRASWAMLNLALLRLEGARAGAAVELLERAHGLDGAAADITAALAAARQRVTSGK